MKKIFLFFIVIAFIGPIHSFANNDIVVTFYRHDSSLLKRIVPEPLLEEVSRHDNTIKRFVIIPDEAVLIHIEVGDYKRIFSVQEIEHETLNIHSSIFIGIAYLQNKSSKLMFDPR